MSSYALLARLSNVEGSADDLQNTINSLDVSKQDNLENANVAGGQAIKIGSVLNKIGTQDTTLTVETSGNIIKLGVDKTVIHNNPVFTGTVTGIDKTMVGLGNVDNTSDANKPISTLTQNSLNLKAPLASPAFTGTVTGVSKSMVGLGSVDNTSDTNKPVSTLTQTALNAKAPLESPAFTGTMALTGNLNASGNVTAYSNVVTNNTQRRPSKH